MSTAASAPPLSTSAALPKTTGKLLLPVFGLLGSAFGAGVGVAVGFTVGVAVGAAVGLAEGVAVGFTVGVAVGAAVGLAEGAAVGVALPSVSRSEPPSGLQKVQPWVLPSASRSGSLRAFSPTRP